MEKKNNSKNDLSSGIVTKRSLGAIPSDLSSLDSLEKKRGLRRDVPSTVDHRPYLLPPRDQGSYPTCVAHAFSAIKEWQSRYDANLGEYLSPMFIYDQRVTKGQDGMNGVDAMNICQGVGICKESIFPYISSNYNVTIDPTTNPAIFSDAGARKIKNILYITTIAGTKDHISTFGPVYIAFPVYNYSTTFWLKGTNDGDILGYHGVCLVGYDSTGFILRNSWGTSWGNGGYSTYPYDHFGAHNEIIGCEDANVPLPNPQPFPEPVNKRCCC